MKFKIEKAILLEGLNKAGKAVTGKVNNPILEGLNIISEDGVMTLTGSDTNTTIKVTITDYEELEPGNIIVEPRILGEIVRKLSDDEIEFSTEENLMEIKSGKSNFKIGFKDGADYPLLDSEAEGDSFIIDSTDFKRAVREVSFAAATDDIRPILNGVYLEYTNTNLNVVAVDGYRLSMKRLTMVNEKDIKVVIDAKSLMEIARLIVDGLDVTIKVTRNYAVFEFEKTIIATRLLDGNYVKYESLIPTEFLINATANRSNLLNSFERAAIMGESNNKLVKLVLENNNLNISAKSQLGKVDENVEVEVDGDSNLTIAFNAKYILDALRAIDSEYITMKFTSSINPCVMEGSDESDSTHLVLPVRLM